MVSTTQDKSVLTSNYINFRRVDLAFLKNSLTRRADYLQASGLDKLHQESYTGYPFPSKFCEYHCQVEKFKKCH